ncbi:MAG: FKBP-type peptidyl-prolyl cis-trans isomerase [Bacteroidota bacterium]
MSFPRAVTFILASLLAFSSCSEPERYPGAAAEGSARTTSTGLMYIDLAEGTGRSPQPGWIVTVHYTGFLMDSTKFDSSLDRGEPLVCRVGVGQVIEGWDEGLMTMRMGGKRKLIIPSHLAYGEDGMPGLIPPEADLVFDVELLDVRSPNE